MTITEEVFCTLQVEGTHNWPECPFEDVAYLRELHRHIFHIKAFKAVHHDDRDVEFIMLKHDIQRYIFGNYYIPGYATHVFNSMSCEMIARELIEKFNLSRCEVSEDNENGVVLRSMTSVWV